MQNLASSTVRRVRIFCTDCVILVLILNCYDVTFANNLYTKPTMTVDL